MHLWNARLLCFTRDRTPWIVYVRSVTGIKENQQVKVLNGETRFLWKSIQFRTEHGDGSFPSYSNSAMRSARSRDVSIVWTCFLMKTVGLWLAADRVEQRRRNFALIYTISAIFIATCIAIRDFYYSWGNFNVSVPESPLSKEFEVYSSDLELLLQDYRVQIPVAAFTMLSVDTV